jgi:hypothetical protein
MKKIPLFLLMNLSILTPLTVFAQNPDPNNGSGVIESAIDDALMNDNSQPKQVPTTAKTPAVPMTQTQQQPVAVQPEPSNDNNVNIEGTHPIHSNKDDMLYNAKVVIPKVDNTKVKVVTQKVLSKNNKKISKDEADYLSSFDKTKKQEDSKGKSDTYEPAPTESQESKHEGFVIERDSSKIIKKRMAYSDSLTVKMCEIAGLSVVFDDDIQTEVQTAIIDDKIFFDAAIFDNHRGAYVKLNQPIPAGKQRETALRLVRKDNDKSYIINLIGVPCPRTGTSPYPKAIYIRDKFPGISGKSDKIMTPEDTIVQLSEGLPRKNVMDLDIYDMIARSTSDWTVFGVQIKSLNGKSFNPEDYSIKMLDNLQIYQLPTKVDFLPIPSEKASKSLGADTARYKVIVNIDKQYMIENRYLYLMLIAKKSGYYQYMKIDVMPWLMNLRKRGFDI